MWRILTTVIALAVCLPAPVRAHCDGLDGPVVEAARQALLTGNVNLVLSWVRSDDEPLIRAAFDSTLVVRKLSETARQLADMYFFETLVRIHRAGEGAPYTGLKPAGRELGPAIPAADRSLESGSVDSVVVLLTRLVQEGVRQHFQQAMDKSRFRPDNVPDARDYVEAYVRYIHYVEGIYLATQSPAEGHADEEGATVGHSDE